jgi:LAO/AO transport system kinase
MTEMSQSPESPQSSLVEFVNDFSKGILTGNRRALAKAITLVESRRSDQREKAGALLTRLLPSTGKSLRLGISGVPGVGKSTFIESLGMYLTRQGHRVAVLTIDPSSTLSGGSILGDKVRMEKLATNPRAFIRSSPSGTTLGGVARRTRECMLLCEAAGYDIVIVETVGVGQSEVTVAEMVDFFLVLMLPNAGDELQGIKRGIMELVDGLVINKADGNAVHAARRAKSYYESSFHYMRPKFEGWSPTVMTCSSLSGEGVEEIWKVVFERFLEMKKTGLLKETRLRQELKWFDSATTEGLIQLIFSNPAVRKKKEQLKEDLIHGKRTPYASSDELLKFITEALS